MKFKLCTPHLPAAEKHDPDLLRVAPDLPGALTAGSGFRPDRGVVNLPEGDLGEVFALRSIERRATGLAPVSAALPVSRLASARRF